MIAAKILLLLIITSVLTACGSFASRFEGGNSEVYYSGVKYSMQKGQEGYGFYYFDVPFSFVFDTVMLPVDAIRIGTNNI
ncbi:YceK/YidQ family lipoprotein [Budvicia diplopodorum]|uniref:YceK/YidQ family lipoprotein n=1 Tax=Budvicia diplopodorum TaxID=1119056 RepID=UPI00135BB97E|nr:YceK/YidQ family lipoprotein [Budvicia diplopodorum]